MAYYRCMMSGGSGDFPVTLTVTCDSNYEGETLYLTKGLTVLSEIVPSNLTVTFTFPENGTWVLSNSLNQETETFVNVGEYECLMLSIPDGKTITPTDDIQIWLNCANIWDKTYTTLAEVLADTDTLSALIASNNAVDYMVRSTTWAVATALVPTMTDDTHPSGECITPSYSEGQEAYKAFDNDLSTTWSSSHTNPNYDGSNYIGYHFDKKIKCTVARFTQRYLPDYSPVVVASIKYQGSNDGVTWTDISSAKNIQITTLSTQVADDTALNVSGGYSYYRAVYLSRVSGNTDVYPTCAELQFYSGITQDSTAMSYIGLNNYCANTLLADSTWCEAICNSEYFESVLNVKVPAMTSDTTPSGEVSAYSYNYSNYPWHAFDGNSTTSSDMWASENLSTWIQYKFATPKKIKCVRFRQFWSNSYQVTEGIIKASNDGVNFTDVKPFTNVPSSDYKYIYLNSNEDSNSYWRMHITAVNDGAASLNELQFYGREDV